MHANLSCDLCSKPDRIRRPCVQQAQHNNQFFIPPFTLTTFQNLPKSTYDTLMRWYPQDHSQSSLQKTKGRWHPCLKLLALCFALGQAFCSWHFTWQQQHRQSSPAQAQLRALLQHLFFLGPASGFNRAGTAHGIFGCCWLPQENKEDGRKRGESTTLQAAHHWNRLSCRLSPTFAPWQGWGSKDT